MGNQRQTDQTAKAVPRLVALLFSLAVIADWAATAPAPVRYTVLLILRRAEAIAYSYIYWELHDRGLTPQWAMPHGCRRYSDPEDAMVLGWWFRILAIALRDLPRRAFFAKQCRLTSPEVRAWRSLPLAGRVDSRGLAGWVSLRQRGPPILGFLR